MVVASSSCRDAMRADNKEKKDAEGKVSAELEPYGTGETLSCLRNRFTGKLVETHRHNILEICYPPSPCRPPANLETNETVTTKLAKRTENVPLGLEAL